MRLSPRIYALADTIQRGETAADIGTDHGYVPMLLVRNGISPYVIMSDISAGSLAKARETFRLAGLTAEEEQFRVGDGLTTIRSGEVDAVIIGGLGGYTIRNILSEDPDHTASFRKLVLQPRKHSGALREYLWQSGYTIIEEKLTTEGKFICEIITAVPDTVSRDRKPLYPTDDIRWAYPEAFADCDPVLLGRRLDWKLGSIQEETANLKKSRGDQTKRIRKLQDDYDYLLTLKG